MYDNRVMTPRSKYYNYFDVEEGKATCKYCNTEFPYSSRIGTNSLRNHIRSRHPEIFKQLDQVSQQEDTTQNRDHFNNAMDIKAETSQLDEFKGNPDNQPSNSISIGPKPAKKRRTYAQYSQYNNNFPFDLRVLGIAPGQSSADPMTQMHYQQGNSSDHIYPQALLDAMTGNDDSLGVDPSAKHDVETIARNLSSVDDALFYLKTSSEILKKWPATNVRIFMQDLLKKAMDEDNKMRTANE